MGRGFYRKKMEVNAQVIYQEFVLEGKIILYIQQSYGMHLIHYEGKVCFLQFRRCPVLSVILLFQQLFSSFNLGSAAGIQHVQETQIRGPQVTSPSNLTQFTNSVKTLVVEPVRVEAQVPQLIFPNGNGSARANVCPMVPSSLLCTSFVCCQATCFLVLWQGAAFP